MTPLLTGALGGMLLAGPLLAQDLDAGRQVAGMCRTCHGLNGLAEIPVAPNIGGESQAYLAAQLRAFRSGARENEMMSVVAAGLSDRQIEDVTAWYAAQQASATLPDGADPGNAPELCVACHGEAGIAQYEDAPNLAGETTIYIDTQLKAFRSGRRQHEVMTGIAADLTDEEIRDAAEWYAASRLVIDPPG